MFATKEKLWSKNFILITISSLLVFLNLHMTLPTFSSHVKTEFQANDFIVSLVVSLFALSAIFTRFFAAYLLQKGKRDLVLYLGLIIMILTTAGYYFSYTIELFLLVRILYGVGFGMISTVLPTMVTYVIPPKRLGEGIGFYGLSTSLALSFGPLIGLFLLGDYGFGNLIFFSTLILLFIFPMLTVKKHIPMESAPLKQEQERKSMIPTATIMPVILNFLLSLTYGGILSFLALFGKENNISNVGYFFLANAAATIMIRPIAGKLFDRKGHSAVIIPGSLAVFFGLTLLTFSTNTYLLIISALFYGLGYGMIQPTLQSWMIKSVPKNQRGTANSLFFNSLDLGIALGAMVLGIIAMNTSYASMYWVCASFMIVFLLLNLISLFVRRKKEEPKLNL